MYLEIFCKRYCIFSIVLYISQFNPISFTFFFFDTILSLIFFLIFPRYVYQDVEINFRRGLLVNSSGIVGKRRRPSGHLCSISTSDARRSGKKFAHIIRAYRTVSRDDWHSARITARRDRYIQEHTMHVMPATSIRRRNTQPTYHRHVRPSIEYAEVLAPEYRASHSGRRDAIATSRPAITTAVIYRYANITDRIFYLLNNGTHNRLEQTKFRVRLMPKSTASNSTTLFAESSCEFCMYVAKRNNYCFS